MKNKIIKLLIHLTIALTLILIYCLVVNVISALKWSIISLTIICIAFCLIFWNKFFLIIKETPIDRYISLISLEIASIVFIQTSFQEKENNKQFEQNRIASESLFKTQLLHSEKLNQLQISNAKLLNDSLVKELNKIQDINLNQSLAAKNQLIATQRQLELSKQSLEDYITETKSNLVLGQIKISNTDTLNEKEFKLTITSAIQNIGKREAEDIEIRQMLIFEDKSISSIDVNKDASFLSINTPTSIHYSPTIPQEKSNNFFYWLQVLYYDKKLDKHFDRSYYRHYYKNPGFDFYYANNDQVRIMRSIIDQELKNKGYSLTIN